MKRNVNKAIRQLSAVCLAGIMMVLAASCGSEKEPVENLIKNKKDSEKVVNLFGPMEKSKPGMNNVSRTAFDQTVSMAEEELGLTVEYRTYTAENYQEKTYDDVSLDRARHGMDDLYLLNPDVIKALGEEGKLADLSGLDSAKNLRDVVKLSNTVDGKLVAIPQEVVAYGLFVNKEMFDKYKLKLPETPEDLMECCRVFKKNGIETPIGANRW